MTAEKSGKGTASQAAEKLGIRIRVCLQAYRKSLKIGPALAAGTRRFSSKQHFSAACSAVPQSFERARLPAAP